MTTTKKTGAKPKTEIRIPMGMRFLLDQAMVDVIVRTPGLEGLTRQIGKEIEGLATEADTIAIAREEYVTDEIEIDDNPSLSPAPDGSGCWVSAWVWVSREEIDDHRLRVKAAATVAATTAARKAAETRSAARRAAKDAAEAKDLVRRLAGPTGTSRTG